ncbi:non-ribosomal peptide synthetase [Hymenobacter sp. CRA2]|uniref:non-ribosomal peptide synthetase n=1 Tax=Hymenobacter sp. CRA2 TaxID=1955620 RepID=UPI00098F32F7|nr:non-ribosomal peptide synthetase [Hymenobacter sp. CRA2]OON70557.1 hypothetical protein B0919_00585 [Hymenobacter sp. CRA2]
MKKVLEFLGGFREKGIHLSIDQSGSHLKLKGNLASLSAQDKEDLAFHKAAILALLRDNSTSSFDSIAPVAQQANYALSSSQMRLWALSQFEAASIAYNVPVAYQFDGALDVPLFEATLQEMIARHEILRTVFQEDEHGEARQYVLEPAASRFRLECQDLQLEAQPEQAARALVNRATNTAFDLRQGPLLRAQLLQVRPTRWVFACTLHHIISDAWSMQVLMQELLLLYNAKVRQEPSPLAPLRIQYKDYTAWQARQLSGAFLHEHQIYWQQQLAGELPVLALPTDMPRPTTRTYNGDVVHHLIEASLCEALRTLTQAHGGTLFMGLLAAANALLYRYTQQEDLIIGSPVAGREHVDLHNQIGFYVNTLALRTRLTDTDSFTDLLLKTKQTVLDATKHQVYPFERLVEDLQLPRDTSRNPLFDVMVVLQNAEGKSASTQQLEGITISPLPEEQVVSKLDLIFHFTEKEGTLQMQVEYNRDLFERATAARLAAHFAQLLQALVHAPATPVHALDFLSAPEREQLLHAFNDTDQPYPRHHSVVDLFEQQALDNPDHVALICQQRTLTYRQLNAHANRLAHYLQAQYQLQPDDLVGLQLERNEWLLISILAILKAGAAYVPIDPEYPQERIDFLVQDSQCKAVVNVAALRAYRTVAAEYPIHNPTATAGPENLAYIIYTSGTTGQPKGVMIERGSLLARMHYFQHLYQLGPDDRALFYHSYSFDASVEEYLLPLLSGATCVIAPSDIKQDLVNNLVNLIGEHRITKMNAPPLLLGELALTADHTTQAQLSTLRHVVSGGDQLTLAVVRAFQQRFAARLYNSYGPTENTIDSTNWPVPAAPARVSIGAPVPNAEAYVLGPLGQLQPLGVPGELYVGGAGLARGYWQRPELTADKFVPHPFRPAPARLYRTGDRARWLPGGTLEFLGRLDQQVKVRGFRVELGEIEAALLRHPRVTAAAVLARPHGADKLLAAYLVAPDPLSAPELRAFLARLLPHHLLPHHFVQLPALPRTPHGKLDRNALPEPDHHSLGAGTPFLAPRTENEQQLVQVLEDVLKHGSIGRQDDFFALGGDSIKSIQIVARLRQRGLALSIRDILLHPVVEELATYLQPVQRVSEQGPVTGLIPLSPVQAAFFERAAPAPHHYNQSVRLQSREPLATASVQAALDALLVHHDALRMRFRPTPQGWAQENLAPGEHAALEVLTVADEAELVAHCERLQAALSLEDGPLLRAGLFHTPQGDELLLVAHHLVVDGVSWRILLEDMATLYQQHQAQAPLQLPQKTDSFLYWQQQQVAYAQSTQLQQEEAYWTELAATPLAALPLDKPAGRNTVQDAAAEAFVLEEATTTRLLTKCHAAYRTEINDVLLTALGLAMQETFGLSRVGVNLEGHGREPLGSDADVTRTVGWFTTVYPAVLDLQHRHDRVRQLIAVKEHLHRIPNKGIGFGVLRYLAGKELAISPEITFNYLGDFGAGVASAEGTPLFTFSGEERGRETADDRRRESVLDVGAMVVAGQLRLSVAYSTEQYEAATIQRLTQAYQQHLLALIDVLAATAEPQATPVDFTWKHLPVEQLLSWQPHHRLEDVYPLSPLQEGFFFHWLSQPDGPVYFEQTNYRVKGSLDVALLQQSYQQLVSRHAALRTVFTQEFGDQPLQVVLKDAAPTFRFCSLAGEPQPEMAVVASKQADRAEGFDLRAEAPIRLTVLEVAAQEYEFIWSHHHILMDGWCGSILIKEFFQLYYGLLTGQAPALPPAPSYATYIAWLMQRDQATATQYWSRYLAGYDTVRALPQQPDEQLTGPAHRQHEFALAEPLRQRLRTYCASAGLTENTFVQTAWGLLLSKYTNAEDVVFGAVVSGRPAELAGVEDMIGLFINTVPVRVHAPGAVTVAELLQQGQQAAIAGVEHHYAQLADIQSASGLGQHLFDHVLVFENYPVQQLVENSLAPGEANGLSLVSVDVFEQGNYDFSVLVAPGEQLTFQFRYNAAKFSAAQMRRMQDHLGHLIEAMVNDPETRVQDLAYLSVAERHQQLAGFNGRTAAYPIEQTLTALFEQQAAATPERPALVCAESNLTYRELNEQANRLAHYLQARHQLRPDELVGLQLERSEWLIVSILAVLKTGAAYVPVDPEYPQQRIEYIMRDSQCTTVLDAAALATFREVAAQYPVTNPAATARPDDLAYVIYTSGSTGQPKGVLIPHAAIINTIWAQQEAFAVVPGERHLQFASPAFDASVSEIFVALLSGSTLYVVSETLKRNPSLFQEYLTANALDLATIPPAYLKLLDIEQLPTLRKLVTAGEPAVAETAAAFTRTGAYFNAYGPTEVSICGSVYRLDAPVPEAMREVPIGVPLPNVQLYVTDEHLNLLPLGAVGEICIGGAGLARGYLRRPELTAEKFVPNPFRAGERMYRTGDLGRWLPDGNLVFVGRKDDQVKIRGHRVELGEIEAALLLHPAVTAAVVTARTDAEGERYLVAYVAGSAELPASELRGFLARTLPGYMLPAHYVQLPELPLTQHGKVDRRQLPDPATGEGAAGRAYAPPRTELETQLVEIWQQILGRKQVGIQDNFFEIGGNSIKIIRLAQAISRVLGQDLSVTVLFQYASIQELVDYLTSEPAPVEEDVFERDELLADLDKFNFSADDFS